MKAFFLKWIRNILAANALAFWPLLWFGLGWMPNQLKVEATRGTEVSLVAEGETKLGDLYAETADKAVWRFFLPRDLGWKELRIRLGGTGNPGDVETLWLQKWLFKCGREWSELEVCPGENNLFRLHGSGRRRVAFASANVARGVLLLELPLCCIAWIFAKRRHVPDGTSWARVLGVAFVCSLLMEVVLPVQSYLANQSSFPYPLGAIWGEVSLRFCMALFVVGAALWGLERCFGEWVSGLAFAFAVCVYLESGVLSIGLPTLKGGWWFFENGKRALWDGLAWGGVFGMAFLLRKWFGKHWRPVLFCFLVLICASMLDLNRSKKADGGKRIVDDFSSIPVVLRSVEYSSHTNVLVFVIDSLEREQAHAVMEMPGVGLELREQFRGFTEFANNFGACDCTLMGIANLLTGGYPESLDGLEDYYESIFSEKSVLKDFLEENYDVYLATDSSSRGYTNRRKVSKDNGGDVRGRILSQPAVLGQPWSLLDFTRFRWMPFGAKARFLRLVSLGLPVQAKWDREWVTYPVLGKAPVSNASRGCFLFVHTAGVHIPVEYNRRGERLAQGDNSDGGCIEMAMFLLGKLGELFDVYRENGVYDNAMIVVLADHGRHEWGRKVAEASDKPPKNALPFLWVKPIGCHHPFRTSGVPTSHAKMAELLRTSSIRTLSEEEIQDCLESNKRRLYRTIDAINREKEDWWMDSGGNVVVEKGLFESVPAELCPLESGRAYSLNTGSLAKEHVAIQFVSLGLAPVMDLQGGCQVWPSWTKNTTSVACSFKVADPSKRYDANIKLLCQSLGEAPNESGASIWFREKEGAGAWEKPEKGVHVSVSLHNLHPDDAGWISVLGKRDNGYNSTVYFEKITISEF